LNEEDLAIWNAQKAEVAEQDNLTVISQNKSAISKSNFDAASALSATRNSMISRVTQISLLE